MKRRRKKHRLKRIWKNILILLLTFNIIYMLIGLCSPKEIQIQLNGDNPQTVAYGTPYNEQGGKAALYHKLIPFIRKTIALTINGSLNEQTPGTYVLHYTASHANISARKDRTVIIADQAPPELTLITNPDHYTLPNHPYEEEGYQAIDNYDGDITNQVQSKESDGYVYYFVSDSSGNHTKKKRKILYDDRTAPVLTLVGGKEMIWFIDQGPFQDSYQAIDDADGDITALVKTEGNVDASKPGDYTIQYTVSDSYHNKTSDTRIVHVQRRPANQNNCSEDNKTIYLTFDDGPGPYTEKLLDILARYNVHATFFTTSTKPQYAYVIAKEASAGHTVAIHTFSHNYANVYASPAAYWNDFSAQNSIIKEQTGSYTTLFRFPGGSSNTVSADYCPGIMSELAQETKEAGYAYFDWNVSSGDAGGTTSSDDVFNNVTRSISANSSYGIPSVVLQHDIKDFSVDAVEKIILWGLENGYHFQPLQSTSYKAHHGINN